LAQGGFDSQWQVTKEALTCPHLGGLQRAADPHPAQKDILGDEYDPLHIMPGRDADGKFTFTKNVDVP
jgi:hypothetical protein